MLLILHVLQSHYFFQNPKHMEKKLHVVLLIPHSIHNTVKMLVQGKSNLP